jgi:hypothetical protein
MEKEQEMKIIRTGAAVSAIMLFFIYSGLILPVTVQRHAGNHREAMARILTDAGYPLTSAQLEQLKSIESGQGIREKVRVILTDKQKEALKNAFKERDATPRHGFMIVKIFKEDECSLSSEQKEQIKAIEHGRTVFEIGIDPQYRRLCQEIIFSLCA